MCIDLLQSAESEYNHLEDVSFRERLIARFRKMRTDFGISELAEDEKTTV